MLSAAADKAQPPVESGCKECARVLLSFLEVDAAD
jgi:hypothetical protein